MTCIAAFIILAIVGVFVAFISIFKPKVGKRYLKMLKKSWGCFGKRITLQKCETGFGDEVKNSMLSRVLLKSPKLVKPLSAAIEVLSILLVVVTIWSVIEGAKAGLALWSLGTCNVKHAEACSLGSEVCSIDNNSEPQNPIEAIGFWFSDWGEIFEAIPDKFRSWDVNQFEFTGINWYSYYILSNNLYFWSPSCTTLVDTAVVETYTKNGYTFYRKITDDVFVIDANPFTVGRQTQEYVNAHPLTPVYLGHGPMHNYYTQLNPREGESNSLAASKEFEQRYGLDTMIYGNPTDKIDVSDFIQYATESRNHIFDHYNIPTENTADMFKFDNIYLHGHLGHLRVFYKNGAIDYLSWTCYEHSLDIYDDLHEYFLTYGPIGETRIPREGQIEESAVVDGHTIFAGYEDSDHGQYTYAFILYQ